MCFKKKPKLCVLISTIFIITLCFGAPAIGAYNNNTLIDSKTQLSQSTKYQNVIDFPPLVYTGGIAANNSQYGATLILHKGDIITISLLEDLNAWNLDKDTLKLEISIGDNNEATQDFILSNSNRSVNFEAKETATHFVKITNPNLQLLNYKFSLNGFSEPSKIELTNLNERRRFGQFLLKANTSYTINASWQNIDIDSVTIILQQEEQIETYEIKNGKPLSISVLQDGVYIIDCINKTSFDMNNFLCTIEFE